MPRLVIKQGKGIGRDVALGAAACIVGRDASAQFVLDDHLASRQHFRIVQEGGAYFVEDLGSTNGTLLNGRRTDRGRLADGDRIQAGGTQLTFVQKDLLGAAGSGAAAKEARSAGSGDPAASQEGASAPVRRRKHLR